ncbi:unnamed protein product [Sphagnum balticum]
MEYSSTANREPNCTTRSTVPTHLAICNWDCKLTVHMAVLPWPMGRWYILLVQVQIRQLIPNTGLPVSIRAHTSLHNYQYHTTVTDTTMYVYNSLKNTTTALASMPQAVSYYGMVDNGDLRVCGGLIGQTFLSTCLQYNTTTNAWQTTFPPLPIGLVGFAMTTLQDKQLYVFGGYDGTKASNTVYTFDNAKKAWTMRAPMLVALNAYPAAALSVDTAMVCGGGITDAEALGARGSRHMTRGAYKEGAYQQERGYLALSLLLNDTHFTGRVLVYGGRDVNAASLASVELLSTDEQAWQTLPTPMFATDYWFASAPLP